MHALEQLESNEDDTNIRTGYYAWERRAVRDIYDDGMGVGEESSEASQHVTM